MAQDGEVRIGYGMVSLVMRGAEQDQSESVQGSSQS